MSEFKRYRKKPVVIEAKQLTEVTFIHTLEGTMQGNPGDWLIKGVQGEMYPCKPDIFAATYEPVKEETDKGDTSVKPCNVRLEYKGMLYAGRVYAVHEVEENT